MSRRTGKPSYLQPAPARRAAGFPRVIVGVAIGLALALLGGLGGWSVGRPDGTEAAIADIEAADARRDAQQIAELTTTARQVRDEIAPVLTAIGKEQPDAARAREFQQVLRRAAEPFADPPSGTTATNVARGGLRGAVDQAALAVDSFAAAAGAPATQRATLTDLARRQATSAAAVWAVAATQLDQINVHAGYGHQHVFLTTDPASGAFTPDGEPEGSGG
ncbi:hypothetical protein [Micromonospora endolithica]|uniref:Uncharacterized protein n=1 Tax=Micromonospora endolithica TaxID=230091 RepID=A0A3A9YU67_9ACTN|nr:hypothetical protein [Micromonospora endolithica]RKN39631.1 hypothetical protein D7223_28450 [Micromonospora endolithica]TWJ22230.1 hypothetical protein JD76_02345 [Micromonospora endolithica]